MTFEALDALKFRPALQARSRPGAETEDQDPGCAHRERDHPGWHLHSSVTLSVHRDAEAMGQPEQGATTTGAPIAACGSAVERG